MRTYEDNRCRAQVGGGWDLANHWCLDADDDQARESEVSGQAVLCGMSKQTQGVTSVGLY